MRDILPDEVELRDATQQTVLAVYRSYGFRRVEAPALESIQLLMRGEGGENEKLIFKVLKRGEKLDLSRAVSEADLVDLGLRFDLTVPLARYYAHNLAKLPKPLKAVQIGPVWRAERPQRGRFRQFTQCDIDILGVKSEFAEIELILATTEALTALGLQDLRVRLNDRRILHAMARSSGVESERYESLFITLDKHDKLGWDAVKAELLGMGHPGFAIRNLMDLLISERDPKLAFEWMRGQMKGQGADDAFDALKHVIEAAEAQGVGIAFDPTLVRGMSYYTGPIFEIQSSRFPSSIAGGGRYDALIGKILGQEVPATGFSIGFERVVSILLEHPGKLRGPEKRIAMVFDERTNDWQRVLEAARRLRAQGLAVSLEFRAGKRGGQLRKALEVRGFQGFAEFDGTEGPEVHWFSDRKPRPGRDAEA